MDEAQLRDLIARSSEVAGVEFKSAGNLGDKAFRASIVRAALGMANRRGGGFVVVGVREEGDGSLQLDGLASDQLADWRHDKIAGVINRYADQPVDVEVAYMELDGERLVSLGVREFDEVPVLCVRDYPNVLRNGACYVRTRGRIETSEVPDHASMRDLLELATEKRVRKASGDRAPLWAHS